MSSTTELLNSRGSAVLLVELTSFLLFFLPIKGEKCCHMTCFRERITEGGVGGEMIQVALFLALFHRLLDILLSVFNFL